MTTRRSALASLLLAGGAVAGPRTAYAARPLVDLRPGAVILFQGDSITEGGRWPAGDPNHSMGQDYAYIVAAQLGARHPERRLSFVNRGVSGDTVIDLAKRWDKDVLAEKPDLLSILVGVNDVFSTGKADSPADYERTYDELIERTRKTLPAVRLVLGEPFLLPVAGHKADYAKDRALIALRQTAVARLAVKHRLPSVRYQRAFDEAMKRAPAEHWSWDGVHPTFAGHGLMAEAWIAAVGA